MNIYYYNQSSYPLPAYPAHAYQPVPHHYYQHHHPYINRPKVEYPPVDTTLFNESAVAFQLLMREADKIINKIVSSNKFATELMTAAQMSNKEKVNQLIQSTGVSNKVKTSFNPDALRLYLTADAKDSECCQLTMILRWR